MTQANTEVAARVFLQVIPKELFEPTVWELDQEEELFDLENNEIVTVEYIEPTGWSNPFSPLNIQAFDLEALHEQSGLTWKQLAVLFNVDVRYVHYWLNGRKMSSEHSDTLIQLVRLIAILNLGAAYKVRKFLEKNLLGNRTLLTLFHKRDFAALENWARQLPPQDHRPDKLPISQDFFRGRLPERPATIMSGISEDNPSPIQGKTRAVRISRKRRKP